MDNIKIYNLKTYINDIFQTDAEDFLSGASLKTGYANIDAMTSLYPGLYVLGAISSLGKTTFMHQLADQVALAGNHVLFFSLEQSVLELTSKSLARIIRKNHPNEALTSLQIRKNPSDDRVKEALIEYSAYANNITIVECSFSATIKDIEDYTEEYINKTHIKPIVIIDYLQVVKPENDKLSTKDSIDDITRRLKILQNKNKLVLFMISSLNRQNYLSQIDFESFKESGGIEYTADVVWGLQLQIIHNEIFDSANKINEKRQKIKEAKAAIPRKVELVCLKNRFGIASYSCGFDYYPHRDYFSPDVENINLSLLEEDKDGWAKIPAQMVLPFD